MADEAVVEEVQEEGKSRRMLVPLIGAGAAMLVVGLGLGFGVSTMMGDGGDAADAGVETSAEGDENSAAMAASTTPNKEVVALGAFTINLRDSAGGRILQMDISVECSSDGASLVKTKEAQLRDAIIIMASDFSYLELEGANGKMKLRDDAHRRINAVLEHEKCSRVYFTKFVVQ